MASYTLSPIGGAGSQFFDNSGNVLSGGKLYTYLAGTTTPAPTYTTPAGTTANSNPVVFNSAGRPANEIWLASIYVYKFVLKDANDVLIATYDNIPGLPQPLVVNDASSISYEPNILVNAGSFVVGQTYMIASLGNTDFTAIGAVYNSTGIIFTASGAGTGTGTAYVSTTVETRLRAYEANGGSDYIGFLQAGTGAITNQTVQDKLRETVSVKDFGAVGDGVANDTVAVQAAWDALKAKGGGTLYFPTGTYLINLVGKGSDGVAIIGDGPNTVLCSYNVNDWAVKYDTGYLKGNEYISNITFRDTKGTQSRHGLYVNTANGFPITNVFFVNNGIGFCCNGSYGFTFRSCKATSNYCGYFITTSTGANTSITNVNGQTVQITDAFFPQHPGIQFWDACDFSGQIGVYFEQPDNIYQKEFALKFSNGVVSTSKCGLYFNGTGSHNISIDNVWFEGALGTVPIRSLTLPATYIYSEQDINISNTTLGHTTIGGNCVCTLDNVALGDSSVLVANDNATYNGRNLNIDARSVDFYVATAKNHRANRQATFLTSPKVSISGAYRGNLVHSDTGFSTDPALGGWSIVADGVFQTKECREITVAPSTSVFFTFPVSAPANKILVATWAMKSVSGPLPAYTGTGIGSSPFVLSTNWKHFAMVNVLSSPSSGSPYYTNQNASSQTIRQSGVQIYAFDTYQQVAAFLASSAFTIA